MGTLGRIGVRIPLLLCLLAFVPLLCSVNSTSTTTAVEDVGAAGSSSHVFETYASEEYWSNHYSGFFEWEVENYSDASQRLYSPEFTIAGFKWRLLAFPSSTSPSAANPKTKYLSLYLESSDTRRDAGLKLDVYFRITLINPHGVEFDELKETSHVFSAKEPDWGWAMFAEVDKVTAQDNGFLYEGNIVVRVDLGDVQVSRVEVSSPPKRHSPNGNIDTHYSPANRAELYYRSPDATSTTISSSQIQIFIVLGSAALVALSVLRPKRKGRKKTGHTAQEAATQTEYWQLLSTLLAPWSWLRRCSSNNSSSGGKTDVPTGQSIGAGSSSRSPPRPNSSKKPNGQHQHTPGAAKGGHSQGSKSGSATQRLNKQESKSTAKGLVGSIKSSRQSPLWVTGSSQGGSSSPQQLASSSHGSQVSSSSRDSHPEEQQPPTPPQPLQPTATATGATAKPKRPVAAFVRAIGSMLIHAVLAPFLLVVSIVRLVLYLPLGAARIVKAACRACCVGCLRCVLHGLRSTESFADACLCSLDPNRAQQQQQTAAAAVAAQEADATASGDGSSGSHAPHAAAATIPAEHGGGASGPASLSHGPHDDGTVLSEAAPSDHQIQEHQPSQRDLDDCCSPSTPNQPSGLPSASAVASQAVNDGVSSTLAAAANANVNAAACNTTSTSDDTAANGCEPGPLGEQALPGSQQPQAELQLAKEHISSMIPLAVEHSSNSSTAINGAMNSGGSSSCCNDGDDDVDQVLQEALQQQHQMGPEDESQPLQQDAPPPLDLSQFAVATSHVQAWNLEQELRASANTYFPAQEQTDVAALAFPAIPNGSIPASHLSGGVPPRADHVWGRSLLPHIQEVSFQSPEAADLTTPSNLGHNDSTLTTATSSTFTSRGSHSYDALNLPECEEAFYSSPAPIHKPAGSGKGGHRNFHSGGNGKVYAQGVRAISGY